MLLKKNTVYEQVGPSWLMDERIASVVAETMLAGEVQRGWYELHAWVVMPTHVHLLLTPKVPLSQITRWIKGSTARRANLIPGRTGLRFWKEESFDRWMRSSDELNYFKRYIENNPISAGYRDWRWCSARGQAEPPVPPWS